MFDWKVFEQHKNILSQAGACYTERSGQHHVTLRPRDLLRWIEFLKDDLGYLILVDIVSVDLTALPEKNYHFEMIYHLFSPGTHQRLNLHVLFNNEEKLPSVEKYYAHAVWLECEQVEMLGVGIDRPECALILPAGSDFPLRKGYQPKAWPVPQPALVPKLRFNPNKSEAPYPEESWEWKHFGLLEPETLGRLEMQVCFDPLKAMKAKTQIGFYHKGFEKRLEQLSWKNILHVIDLINPGIAPTGSIIWAKNLEEILRIRIPERAQAIRIVMLELARISEHLSVLFEMSAALKKAEASYFLDAKEKVSELFEKFGGHRLGFGMNCLGGVREDLPHGWSVEFQEVSDLLKKNLKVIHKTLISSLNFRTQLEAAGVNAQIVLKWGVSGPVMRASGLNFDLRKSQPFYFYQDIDFEIPVGIYGTCYDRYLIRYEEIYQSLRIITQVLDNLPLGEVVNWHDIPEKVEDSLKAIAGLWHYSSLEAPNGEMGIFAFYTENLAPYRIKLKTPSLMLAQAFPEFVRGIRQEQLQVLLASLGIRASEMDR
jgi:NADH-quinone oxidoreductase subunit C/D